MEDIKVLIADDEKIECIALEKMIRELFTMVTVLPSAYDGMELIQAVEEQNPDIAIVDIHMPGLNGLEALEILRMKHYGLEIIIHTAYNEFDYLHKAMQLRAYEFLVKPVTQEVLVDIMYRTIEVVQERRKREKTNEQKQEIVSEEMKEVINNSIMMSLMLQKPDVHSYHIWQNICQTGSGGGNILCVQFDGAADIEKAEKKLLSEVDRHCIGLHYFYHGKLYLYLLNEKITEEPESHLWLNQWLPDVMKRLEESCDCEVTVGVSQMKDRFEAMGEAVQEADLALNDKKWRMIHYYGYEPKRTVNNIFRNMEKKLADKVLHEEEKSTAEYLMAQIRDHLRKTKRQDTEKISLRTGLQASQLFFQTSHILRMQLRKTGMKWTVQGQVRGMLALFGVDMENAEMENENTMFQCHQTISAKAFQTYLESELRQMKSDAHRPLVQSNKAVESAMRYIQNNYARDLSLEETAEHAGVTKFYLNRLLKQERNQTFIEILTDIRLYYALQYIEEGIATNQNISYLIGYSTVGYFQQVFKRKLGISPGEYRRILEEK